MIDKYDNTCRYRQLFGKLPLVDWFIPRPLIIQPLQAVAARHQRAGILTFRQIETDN